MSVSSPLAILSWTSLTWAAYLAPSALVLPMPTPPDLTSKTVSAPPLNVSAWTPLIDVEDRLVDVLHRRGHDLIAEVGLVGVDADRLHALLLGGVDHAEAALARDLEDDLRALLDLVERELLALRLVDEVLRVAVDRLDVRVRGLRAGLVAGDVVVDRRDLLAADGADRLAVVVLDVEARHVAGEVARLLLLEEQALDVGRLALQTTRRRRR